MPVRWEVEAQKIADVGSQRLLIFGCHHDISMWIDRMCPVHRPEINMHAIKMDHSGDELVFYADAPLSAMPYPKSHVVVATFHGWYWWTQPMDEIRLTTILKRFVIVEKQMRTEALSMCTEGLVLGETLVCGSPSHLQMFCGSSTPSTLTREELVGIYRTQHIPIPNRFGRLIAIYFRDDMHMQYFEHMATRAMELHTVIDLLWANFWEFGMFVVPAFEKKHYPVTLPSKHR